MRNLRFQRSTFCTSLALNNIDRRCFVVCCQNLPKCQRTKVTFYIQKWAKSRATSAQLFQIFCSTSATSLEQLLDFFGAQLSGGLGLPIVRERQQMFHFELPSEQLEKKGKESLSMLWQVSCKLFINDIDWCAIDGCFVFYFFVFLEVDRISASVSVSAPNVDKLALSADIRFRPKAVVLLSVHFRFRRAVVGKFGGCRNQGTEHELRRQRIRQTQGVISLSV